MQIRRAGPDDRSGIWAIIGPIIRAGETYTLEPAMTKSDALACWLGPDKQTFVAEDGRAILGTYYLRPNQAGGGAHICNRGYMTHPAATGRGVAWAMGRHSLPTPSRSGIGACSSTSSSAPISAPCASGSPLGFAVVGRLPLAFRHPVQATWTRW